MRALSRDSFAEICKSNWQIPTQIEEKTPGSVKNLKKEAASVAEKVAEKVEKVATPVAEAVAPKRVSFCKQNSKASQYVANDDSASSTPS